MENWKLPRENGTTASELDHLVETRDMQPDVCMLYPEAADERRQTAAWIAAEEPCFVDLSTRL